MIRALCVGVCMLGTALAAENVPIRSGQHESFSRLVLTIPEGRDWQLARAGAGYRLLLGAGEDTFDTSGVFDRIPANRISELSQQDGQLQIDLACDCHADAFLWRADRLVVDIIDGPAPPGSEFEVASAAPIAPIAPVDSPSVRLPIVTTRAASGPREPLVPGTFDETAASDNRIAEAERAIIESLARAASQGMFELPSRPLSFAADNLVDGEDPFPTSGLPALTPVTDPMDGVASMLQGLDGSRGPGLVLRSGIERADDGRPGAETVASHCIGDEQVSIHEWGDDRDYSAQIADRRRALTSEFDAYPEGAIESLAQTYLFFGFGQEARQVLRLDGQWSRTRMILDAMSHVVDSDRKQSDALEDQLDCDGFVILWAALSTGRLDAVGDSGRNAAIMAFRVLPEALRGHIGADFAQLLVTAGDPVMADIVLSAARAVDSTLSIEAELTTAAVAENLEGPQSAINMLDALADENTRMTPTGLARLLELQLAQGQLIDEALLSLASVIRFEAGRSEDAQRLAMAEIDAYLARDDFDTALSIAEDEAVSLSEPDRNAAVSSVYSAMAERQNDQAFLSVAFASLPSEIDADAENAIARRLIAMGFPERAKDLLAGPAAQAAMAERRYLRAEAAVAVNDLDAVEQALSGLSDARATAIRARAFMASGDYESALALDLALSDTNAAPAEAWRAGAWTLLETGDDPLLQSASRAILTDEDPSAAISSLAERRDLLDQAAATREMTEALLGRFGVTPAE